MTLVEGHDEYQEQKRDGGYSDGIGHGWGIRITMMYRSGFERLI
ncbi:hypothetical protein [Vibrio spartinae]|nr:hypothetical protein [Vibrio spartinae]